MKSVHLKDDGFVLNKLCISIINMCVLCVYGLLVYFQTSVILC